MSLKIKINVEGRIIEKSIEQLVYDADVADKKFLIEVEGPNVLHCIDSAVKSFPSDLDFVNNVNYYRVFNPSERFRARYPTKVEFYK